MEAQAVSLSGTKMYALVEKNTDIVQFLWVGDDEKKSDHDPKLWYLVEMTKENSPAYGGGKYKNGKFYRNDEVA